MFSATFHHGLEAVVINTAALLLTLVGFGVFVSLYGHDPLEVFYVLYLGAFAAQISIESTLTQAAPVRKPFGARELQSE